MQCAAEYPGWLNIVSEWVGTFLTAHQHILGYLVPYHGMVDLHKRGT